MFSQNLRCRSYCSYYALQGNRGPASKIDLSCTNSALDSVSSGPEPWAVCSCPANGAGVVFSQNLRCRSYCSYCALQGNRGPASRIALSCTNSALDSVGSGPEPWAVCSCLANRAGVVFSQNLCCSSYCGYCAVQGNRGLASRIDLLCTNHALESVGSGPELWAVYSCLANRAGVVFSQNLRCSSYCGYCAVQGNQGLASRIDLSCTNRALESVGSGPEP